MDEYVDAELDKVQSSFSFSGARSKVITTSAYWRLLEVKHVCQESTFLKDNVSGYNVEWIRYGYFEFTQREYIQPTQHVVVLKKVSTMQLMYDNIIYEAL